MTAAGNYAGVLVLLAGVSVGVGVLVERLAVALVVFAAYRPRTLAEEQETGRRHRAPKVRLDPAARAASAAAFACSALASLVLIVAAFV